MFNLKNENPPKKINTHKQKSLWRTKTKRSPSITTVHTTPTRLDSCLFGVLHTKYLIVQETLLHPSLSLSSGLVKYPQTAYVALFIRLPPSPPYNPTKSKNTHSGLFLIPHHHTPCFLSSSSGGIQRERRGGRRGRERRKGKNKEVIFL